MRDRNTPLPTRLFELREVCWVQIGDVEYFGHVCTYEDGRDCRYIGYQECWAYVVATVGHDGRRVEYVVAENQLRKLDHSKTKGMVDVERERIVQEIPTD